MRAIFQFCFFVLVLSFLSCDDIDTNENKEPVSAKKILYEWNFSDEKPFHDLAELTENVSVVSDPLDSTNKVQQFILNKGESRTEVSVGASSPHYFYADKNDSVHGEEFWVGFKILKFKEPFTGANTSPSIFQIGPIQNTVSNPGITSKGHYQLMLNTESDEWKWREYSSDFNPNSYSSDISTINYGKWDRLVFHCIFRSDDTALIEIWQNDKKIYSKKRQNGTKHSRTRIKWGIYVGTSNKANEKLTCYFDDIKIGNQLSGYNDVVPK